MTTYKIQDFDLLFLPSGKVKLQSHHHGKIAYSHVYNKPWQAAKAVTMILQGCNPATDWDLHRDKNHIDINFNDPGAAFSAENKMPEDVIFGRDQIIALLHRSCADYANNNVRKFFTSLRTYVLQDWVSGITDWLW